MDQVSTKLLLMFLTPKICNTQTSETKLLCPPQLVHYHPADLDPGKNLDPFFDPIHAEPINTLNFHHIEYLITKLQNLQTRSFVLQFKFTTTILDTSTLYKNCNYSFPITDLEKKDLQTQKASMTALCKSILYRFDRLSEVPHQKCY